MGKKKTALKKPGSAGIPAFHDKSRFVALFFNISNHDERKSHEKRDQRV
jgi:hypothetical protein